MQRKLTSALGAALVLLLVTAYFSYRGVRELAATPGEASARGAYLTIGLGSVLAILLLLFGGRRILGDLAARQRAEEELERFFTLSLDMLCILDLNGRFQRLNPMWEKVLGYSSQELMRQPSQEFLHPDDREPTRAEIAKLAAGGTTASFENRFRTKDGSYRSLQWNAVGLPQAGLIYAGARDISERVRAERELRSAHDQLTRSKAELEQRTLDITRLSEMGDLLQSCHSAAEAFQIAAQGLPQLFPFTVGALYVMNQSRNLVESAASWGGAMPGESVFAPDDCWALRRSRMHAVANVEYGDRCPHVPEKATSGFLCLPLLAQGEAIGILHLRTAHAESSGQKTISLLFTDSGKRLAQAVAEQIALAISNLRLRETLRQQTIRDPLTGLYNRRFLEESLERELRRAARGKRPLAVLMIDLDHFKRFNDTFGHDAGDMLLRELGRLLQGNVRGSDIACRYGGEEFALILPDASPETAQERAELIRKAAKRLDLKHAGQALGAITLSVGIASFPGQGDSPAVLMRAADQALYRAKAAGRDRVVLAESAPAPGPGAEV